MVSASVKELLDAGAHFGHQTQKWNPNMKPFIFGRRNGIHVINLEITSKLLEDALTQITEATARGGVILFVGTKKQGKDLVRNTAEALEMPYVAERWLGGMLTNNQTIRKSINKLENILTKEEDGSLTELTKKEQSVLQKEKARLMKNLLGVKEMKRLPDLLFIVDPSHEMNAVGEARKLGIPILAMVDTNCEPTVIDHPIPCNDDAMRSIQYILEKVQEAVTKGQSIWKKKEAERLAREAEEKAKEEAKKAEQQKKAEELRKAKEAEEKAEKAKTDALIADLEQKKEPKKPSKDSE